jgi:hypothetical protein
MRSQRNYFVASCEPTGLGHYKYKCAPSFVKEIQQNGCSLRWRAEREKQMDNHCPVQWSLLSLIVPHATLAIVVATSSHLHNLVHPVITNCQAQMCLCSSRKHNLSDVLTVPPKKKCLFQYISSDLQSVSK